MGWNIAGGIQKKLNKHDVANEVLQNDFVFLSETQSRGKWQFRLIPHYHIFRKDREVGKAGGIAWLVRNEIVLGHHSAAGHWDQRHFGVASEDL